MMNMKSPRVMAFAAVFVFMAFAPSTVKCGNVTYTLSQVANPTTDESSAYAKIKIAMDSAVLMYNTYTSITKKLSVSYNTSVATADGNTNGSIRFGSSRSYMVCGTAMHEIAHTVGVGLCSAWPKLIVNGRYTGVNADAMYQTIIGKKDSLLHGDTQHFWPYGINYESEVKSSADLIDHCKIVNAMQADFYPGAVIAQVPAHSSDEMYLTARSGSSLVYGIPEACFVKISMFTLSGRTVAVLEQGTKAAGENAIDLNYLHVPRGNYIFQFAAGEHSENRTIMIVR
jgi:hypothetical protein